MPTIFPVIAADGPDPAQAVQVGGAARVGPGANPSHPFGEYAAKTLGYRKVAVFGTDYAFRLRGWSAASSAPSRRRAAR